MDKKNKQFQEKLHVWDHKQHDNLKKLRKKLKMESELMSFQNQKSSVFRKKSIAIGVKK